MTILYMFVSMLLLRAYNITCKYAELEALISMRQFSWLYSVMAIVLSYPQHTLEGEPAEAGRGIGGYVVIKPEDPCMFNLLLHILLHSSRSIRQTVVHLSSNDFLPL